MFGFHIPTQDIHVPELHIPTMGIHIPTIG